MQQQVVPRVSADFGYTHRSFHGFFVTDDINRNPATSYESYTLTRRRIRGSPAVAAIRLRC